MGWCTKACVDGTCSASPTAPIKVRYRRHIKHMEKVDHDAHLAESLVAAVVTADIVPEKHAWHADCKEHDTHVAST